jgi:hypothetical protein
MLPLLLLFVGGQVNAIVSLEVRGEGTRRVIAIDQREPSESYASR